MLVSETMTKTVAPPTDEQILARSRSPLILAILERFYDGGKRVFDFALAASLLVLLSPLFVVITGAILLESDGPPLYIAERTGRFGRRFRILKFRTMIPGSDAGARTTAHNDARVTRVGYVLRHSKLDELPQLVNVLRGEMSFVGPRPELPYYTDRYSGDELQILAVRPGITDIASLRFSSLASTVGPDNPDQVFEACVLPEKNLLRIQYVRERSFRLDLELIVRTAWAVILQCFKWR